MRQLDATLAELREALQAHTGQRGGIGSVWCMLDEQELRHKKTYMPVSVIRHVCSILWHQHMEHRVGQADVYRFYFLDEIGLRLEYTRRYARDRSSRRVN